MNYLLFLDDFRPIDAVRFPSEYDLTPKILARNYNEFVETIQKSGVPTVVSFDFDLSVDAIKEHVLSLKRGYINYDNIKSKTGLDCAKFLVGYCKENKVPFPVYFIHSQNALGARDIKKYIEANK